jgi:hypothetical protein
MEEFLPLYIALPPTVFILRCVDIYNYIFGGVSTVTLTTILTIWFLLLIYSWILEVASCIVWILLIITLCPAYILLRCGVFLHIFFGWFQEDDSCKFYTLCWIIVWNYCYYYHHCLLYMNILQELAICVALHMHSTYFLLFSSTEDHSLVGYAITS